MLCTIPVVRTRTPWRQLPKVGGSHYSGLTDETPFGGKITTLLPRSILLTFLFCSHIVLAQPLPELKAIPDLKPASEYPKEQIEQVAKLAFRHWQFLAEESPNVAGSYKTARAIPGFSQKGDLIWEVRIIHLVQAPTGILWINDRTKEALVLGPQK